MSFYSSRVTLVRISRMPQLSGRKDRFKKKFKRIVGHPTGSISRKAEVCQLLLNQKLIGLRFLLFDAKFLVSSTGSLHLPPSSYVSVNNFEFPLVIGSFLGHVTLLSKDLSVKFIASWLRFWSLPCARTLARYGVHRAHQC